MAYEPNIKLGYTNSEGKVISGIDKNGIVRPKDNGTGFVQGGSTPGGIGAYHLSDNPRIYEIQRTNNFIMIISDVNRLKHRQDTVSKDTIQTTSWSASPSTVLRCSIKAASIPTFSQSPIEVRRGNSVIKFAGVPSFSSGTLECYDFIGADVTGILTAWQAEAYNVETEKVGLVTDYKRSGYLIQLSPDGEAVRAWRMSGMWVSNLDLGRMDYDSNDKHTISVSVEYDKAVIWDIEKIDKTFGIY